MMIRRIETRPAPEPPVRLYKIIALSFLVITIVLLSVVIFLTSKKATITIFSKQDSKHISLTLPVNPAGDGQTTLKGTVSSTVFSWSKKYYPTGTKTADGLAQGDVVIYNTMSAPQQLVKTTRLLTAGGVLFHLSDGVIVPPGGQLTAKVYADQPGPGGDIGPSDFTIPGLNDAKQKLVYAKSTSAMEGGEKKTGILSAADIDAAKEDFKRSIKDVYLQNHGPDASGQSQVVTVGAVAPIVKEAAGKEVSEFTVSALATLVVVSYDPDELLRALNTKTGAGSFGGEKILSASKQPVVNLASYDLSKATAELSISEDVQVSLDSAAPALTADKFAGKKKSDIEQYVMGLEHVAGVEVKLSPAWARSAPGAADRIKVIVKNIN